MLHIDCPEYADLRRILRKKDEWLLVQDYPFRLYQDNELIFELVIKRGFVLDFASVPWLFLWLIPKVGQKSDGGALVHDAGYAIEAASRFALDKIFELMLKHFEVNRLKTDAMYSAVRVGGWYTWRKHTKQSIADNQQFVQLLHIANNLDQRLDDDFIALPNPNDPYQLDAMLN